jgi:hypothetical protein
MSNGAIGERVVNVRVIGIDCATQDSKVGLAFGCATDRVLRIDEVHVCSPEGPARRRVANWMSDDSAPTLLGIDAPLGWPVALGPALQNHRAGAPIGIEANKLFRRETDRFIQSSLGVTPLDVGADRIARTAHAAIRLVAQISQDLHRPLPLAWGTPLVHPASIIEVYPAATLRSYGLPHRQYKSREDTAVRERILRGVAELAILPQDMGSMLRSADALDAAICMLATFDFVRGLAIPPKDFDLAQVEGWIWARARSAAQSCSGRTKSDIKRF